MFKKMISLLLCATMCMPIICMADTTEPETAVATEKKVYTLTLEDAIEMALENDTQLKVSDYQKESYRYGLESAKIMRKNNKNSTIYASSGYELGYIKEGYYIDLYETQMKLADLNKEKTKASIIHDVTGVYYQYILTDKLMELAWNTYNMALENMDYVNKMNELGMISNIEVQNAQLTVDSSYTALESAQRALDICKDSFKVGLNVEEDCDFVLTSEIVLPEFSADLEKDIENAMTTRCDVITLDENLRLAESHFKLTEKFATKNTSAYYSDLSTYMQTKHTAEDSKKMIKIAIKASYSDVLTLRDNLTSYQRAVEIQKSLYEAAKLKFEMGMITNIDLTDALTDYSKAEQDYEQAKLDYLLAVEKYNYDITIGL